MKYDRIESTASTGKMLENEHFNMTEGAFFKFCQLSRLNLTLV